MRLFRMLVLGTAGVVAYRLWKQRQAAAADASYPSEHDLGEYTTPHGDALIGAATASWEPEPAIPAAQSSRGFGGV